MNAAIATALADNPVGRLVEDFILQGGVDPSLIRWVPYDGVGRASSAMASEFYGARLRRARRCWLLRTRWPHRHQPD